MSKIISSTLRKAVSPIFLAALVAAVSGCASSGYLADRRVDALDIVTATIGEGYGIRAQAGPANVGLLVNEETRGLKGGEAVVYEDVQAMAATIQQLLDDPEAWESERMYLRDSG